MPASSMHRDITGDHPNFTDSHIAVKTVIRKVWEWSGKDTYWLKRCPKYFNRHKISSGKIFVNFEVHFEGGVQDITTFGTSVGEKKEKNR